MQQVREVVIIGGGVIGSSIAYFLSTDNTFSGKVTVIERDWSYQTASSSRSTSAIRQQFATPPNIAMSRYGIEFLRKAPEHLAIGDEKPNIELQEPGYLFLASGKNRAAFVAKHALQKSAGVKVELLEPSALAVRFPWLSTDGISVASLGLEGEGWFDGFGLLQAYRKKARAQNVEYIQASVVGIEKSSPDKIEAVILDDGRRIACGTAVNAAGPYSGQVAAMAGIDLAVVPRKRCVFVFDSPLKLQNAPFLFDTSGIFLRAEGQVYICGTTPPEENSPDDFSLDVDYDLFDEIIWPALAERIPAFETLKLLRAWAGHYEYNVFDHSAILGAHPQIKNFIFATGFSGHGMMHSPGAGLGISELIRFGEFRTLDLRPFSFTRIAEGRAIEEPVF